MKRILAIILTMAMMVLSAVAVYAAGGGSNVINGEGSDDINVSGGYTAPTAPATVISVDIAWDEMNFTYTEGSKGTWDEWSHDYVNPGQGSWSTDTATITVTNHSNTAIKAEFTFSAEAAGVRGTFSNSTLDIVSADDDLYRPQQGSTMINAPTASTEFGIEPTSAGIAAATRIGTITVAVSPATN